MVTDKNGHIFSVSGFRRLARQYVGRRHRHRASTVRSEALPLQKRHGAEAAGITSASPSIVSVIAALDQIICSMSRDNDSAQERCGSSRASCEQSAHKPDK